MEDANHYARLWNGNEPGWVVVRHTEDRVKLHVEFSDDGPTIQELKALRLAVPRLAQQAATEVLRAVKGKPVYFLGELESGAARKLREQCESLGLRVAAHGHTATCYNLVNEQTNRFLLIEDSATLQAVAEEAIKQGLPVRHSTV